VSQLDNKFGRSSYPMCVGHEIVGHATQIGSDVQKIKVGDRVGVGAQRDSCGTCKHCKKNEANLCSGIIPTYNYKYPDGTPAYGGYSKFIRVNEKFVHKIPDNLPSERKKNRCNFIQILRCRAHVLCGHFHFCTT
jgi:alcohol dehydrogenase (NADP+)